MSDNAIVLSIVVPVYNERDTVPLFLEELEKVFIGKEKVRLEVLFINDGSTDDTLEVLRCLANQDPKIAIIDLARNFGKEAALSAGLQYAKGDVIVPIDVDLQDPPELIHQMIEKWKLGYEVVLGKRADRESDSWAKRHSAKWFYKIHNKIADPAIPENVGDFRLMDRKVVDALNELPESRRFMKGLFAWIGFKTTYVEYLRPERCAGTSKFNGWKLWNFALEGITSFSTAPLRVWTYGGFLISLISFIYAAYIVLRVLVSGVDLPGHASTIVAILFFGGLQLMGIGFIGEYLGRTYLESKRRPAFVVREVYYNKVGTVNVSARHCTGRPTVQ
jgi:glycosyltransferase involved in cell wall biosynthesis